MIKGTTSIGFNYEIDERIRSDRRVIKQIVKVIKNDGNEAEQLVASFDLAEALLGAEQSDRLESFIAEQNDGFCDNNAFDSQMMEIFKGDHDLKN